MANRTKLPAIDRLMRSIKINDSGCWISSLKGDKYARLTLPNKKYIYGHRLMYEEKIGPIPPGIMVCHTCDTPRCVNPEHLFLGTAKDNMADMIAKGRHVGNFKDLKNRVFNLAKQNPTQTAASIAVEIGCSLSTVFKCLKQNNLTRGAAKGTQLPRAKFTDEDIYYIRKSKEHYLDLAKQFGVTYSAIYAVKKRATWKHLPEEPTIDIEEKPCL